jgi:diacylglycerol kinase family enzyme
MRRVAVVTNGKAGALLDAHDDGPGLPELFAAAGLQAEFIPNDSGGLTERMREALSRAPDAVIVAGGDGTVACAAQVMAGTGVPLGILPFGTMNLLAKDLGLPIGDPAAALQTVAAWSARAIDVGEVNGRTFLCASMLGLPARLGRHREETRGSSARLWVRMARATLRHVVHMVPLRAEADIGGETVRLRAAAVTITVNPVEESVGSPFARRRLDGGTLVVYAVGAAGAARLLGFALRVATGRWRSDPEVTEYAAPFLTIRRRGKAMQVMNDGELMLLEPPLKYRCRTRALVVLAAP